MSTHDEQELKKFLDGDNDYRRAYQSLPKAHPPAALDDAILAAARAQTKRDARPTWLVPLSLAATIVLGVGLSIRQLTPPSTFLPKDMVLSDAPAVAAADSAAAPAAVAPERDALAPPAEEYSGVQADVSESPTALRDNIRARTSSGRSLANPEREVTAKMAASELPTQPSAPDPAIPAPPPAAVAAPVASAPLRALDMVSSMSDAQLLDPAYAPAPAAAAARDADRQVVIVTGNRMEVYTKGDPTPDERLKEISALHDAGREREARRLFDEFIKDWPDYELPKTFPYQRR